MARWWVCLTVASMLAGTLSAEEAPQEASGRHFRVVGHSAGAGIVSEALATAEAAWPHALSFYGTGERAPRSPLEIHLYGKVDEFVRVDNRLTGGRFSRNLAFSSRRRMSAHVALQPPCSADTLEAVGLSTLTRRLIAHEAAHLASYGAFASRRSHAEWLTEGAAAWIADRTLVQNGWSAGAEADPFTATDMRRVVELKAGGNLPRVERILRDDYGELSFYDRSAVQWIFFRFLLSDEIARDGRNFIEQCLRLADSGDAGKSCIESAERVFGEHGLSRLNVGFRRYLASLRPQWREVSRTLETAGDEWVQIAFADRDAVAWRAEPVGSARYRLTGKLTILPNGGRRMRILLGCGDEGYISVEFRGGFGIDVRRHRSRDDLGTRLGDAVSTTVAVGREIPFSIAVTPDRVVIHLDGDRILNIEPADGGLTGIWGLGAEAASAGIWAEIRARAEP